MLAMLALAACAPLPREIPAPTEGEDPVADPIYLGGTGEDLGEGFIAITARIRQPRAVTDIDTYTDCLAAGQAEAKDLPYVQRIRTTTSKGGRTWTANAVYTASTEKPTGSSVIEATKTVAACAARSIPTA
ncbi:hypothetical protein [Falsirhodobacter algicola]|uniref:Lipoprotein n=1 Tax=Falsirhodobacter algicola TaxID=2692330 RepID=A0A8J8SK52_9RHOB|nr:hypothetical protein [Falsirhodobacter algicola]QUS35515.1 hypothetical protein GR316_04050 [Falsirhodobacter algicola]